MKTNNQTFHRNFAQQYYLVTTGGCSGSSSFFTNSSSLNDIFRALGLVAGLEGGRPLDRAGGVLVVVEIIS